MANHDQVNHSGLLLLIQLGCFNSRLPVGAKCVTSCMLLRHSQPSRIGVINKVARVGLEVQHREKKNPFLFLNAVLTQQHSSRQQQPSFTTCRSFLPLIDHPPSDSQSNLEELLPTFTIFCATNLVPLAPLHVMEADWLCDPMSLKERLQILSVRAWQDG